MITIHDKLRRFLVVVTLAAVNLIFFAPHYFGHQVTDWDTYLYFFVNFLYFADCLQSGIVPLWNHLVTSGYSFFAHSFHVSHYTPHKFLMALLATQFNPARVFEIYILLPVLAASAGFYLLFREYLQGSRIVPLSLSLLLTYSLFPPILGQVVFLYSLSALPFMLFLAHRIIDGRLSTRAVIVWSIALAYWSLCGYAFLTICNLCCVALYLLVRGRSEKCWRNRRACSGIFLLLGLFAVVYGLMLAPAFLMLKGSYGDLGPDFIPPDPRLRAAVVDYVRAFGLHGFGEWVDSLLGKEPGKLYWGQGIPMAPLIVLFSCLPALVLLPARRKQVVLYWLGIGAAFSFYAVKSDLAHKLLVLLPFGQSNRWLSIGLYYTHIASFGVLAILLGVRTGISETLRQLTGAGKSLYLALWGCALALTVLVGYRCSDWRLLLLLALPLLLLLQASLQWHRPLLEQIAWAAAAATFLIFSAGAVSNPEAEAKGAEIYRLVEERATDVKIASNRRELGNERFFNPDNVEWVYKKIPNSNGYNNQGNPLYWYVRDYPLNATFFTATANVVSRPPLSADQFPHPNMYMETLAGSIPQTVEQVSLVERYTGIEPQGPFEYRLGNVLIGPNEASATVFVNRTGLLLHNQLFDRGWQVSVDGRDSENLKTNFLFNGVVIPAGQHEIRYRYRPRALRFIYAAYIISALSLVAAFTGLSGRRN